MNQADIMENACAAVKLLKSLSHPSRLMILCQLAEGEKTVGDLQQHSHLSQSAFSQHLGRLRKQKWVKARKEGLYVYYSIADAKIAKVLAVLHEMYCSGSQKGALK